MLTRDWLLELDTGTLKATENAFRGGGGALNIYEAPHFLT